jgi:hypothetical protein
MTLPIDHPPCVHCGEGHGPSACKQELSLKLADEINDRRQADKDRGSLWVAVAELQAQVHALEAEVRQL